MLTRRAALLFFAIAAVALAACSRRVPEKPENAIRVVNWNLEWFPGGKPDAKPEERAAQMDAAKKAIRELQPDILLVQEIRDWPGLAELAGAIPGLNVHVLSEFNGRTQNQGIAALLPADSAWAARWTSGPVEPPRGYSFAALALPDGRFLLAYSLHLKSNLGNLDRNVAMRRESARQLLAHASEMLALYRQRGPCALIIAGDMNTSLDDPKFADDPTLRALQGAGLYWTHEGVPFAKRTTIPADENFPDNCFDHIFTLGLGRQTALAVPYQDISDHYPVLLDLDLSKADFDGKLNLEAAEKILGPPRAPDPPKELPGTLAATDGAALRSAVGHIATVRGKVSEIGATNSGSITFIDFEGTSRRKFTAIVRKENVRDVTTGHGGDLRAALVGKTVVMRGKLELYKETPQIEITKPDQITVVPESAK